MGSTSDKISGASNQAAGKANQVAGRQLEAEGGSQRPTSRQGSGRNWQGQERGKGRR